MRGLLKLTDAKLLHTKTLKTLPHIVDTLLLISGITLIVMSGMYPWVVPWVGVKLVAVVVYIIAGSIFMRSEVKGLVRCVEFLISMFIAGFIILVALTKSPSIGF